MIRSKRLGSGAGIVLALAAFHPMHANAADPAGPDFLSPAPIASDPIWAVTVFAGVSGGGNDLHELFYKPWLADGDDYLWGGASVSRHLARFWTHFTIEAEVGVGHRFGPEYTASEAWVAGYLRYDGFPWNEFVKTSVAVSTGLNVIDRLPEEEKSRSDDARSHVLHYFSPEITFAHPDYSNHEFVIRYHHRSGVAGVFNGVWGGSNVIALGYRHRW
ncbi:MAG TPA: hypothetical protein VMP03_00795 [Methylomirabilota bacterium]|nr:hypothetical protein [Methylomirabilota bacterium]